MNYTLTLSREELDVIKDSMLDYEIHYSLEGWELPGNTQQIMSKIEDKINNIVESPR